MKSKQLLLTGILAVSMASASLASVCRLIVPVPQVGSTYNGPTICHEGTLSDVHVNGPVHMKGTTITDLLSVNGPAMVESAKIADVKINGPLMMLDSTLTGKQVKINGPLMAKKSMIKGDINIATKHIKLDQTSAKNIVVRAGHRRKSTIVDLENHSVVSGDIIFKGKAGVVVLKTGSVVKGQVINGRVKK